MKFLVLVLVLFGCSMDHDVEHKVIVEGDAEIQHKFVISEEFCEDFGYTPEERKECKRKLLKVLEKCSMLAEPTKSNE